MRLFPSILVLAISFQLCQAQVNSGTNTSANGISFQSNRLKFFLYCMENKKDGLYIFQQVKETYKIVSICNSETCGLALKSNPYGKDVIGVTIQPGLMVYSWIDPLNFNYEEEKLYNIGFSFFNEVNNSIVFRNCQKKLLLKISLEDHHTYCELTYAPTAYYALGCGGGIADTPAEKDKITNKGYCKDTYCPLEPSNPLLFDPYYNCYLCVNFNPEQIDFSKEYYDLRIKDYHNSDDFVDQAGLYDFTEIWHANFGFQGGILGSNYRRIYFHFDKVERNSLHPDIYNVIGKSKAGNNVCDFKGEIKIIHVFLNDSCENSEYSNCGGLFANFSLYEDKLQAHSGVFKGIMECKVYLDRDNNKVFLDKSEDHSDGYWNRSYVGTWTDYNTKASKKCIWGDYELPFTFDFTDGDGEKYVNEKYVKNGWKSMYDPPMLKDSPDIIKYFGSKWW